MNRLKIKKLGVLSVAKIQAIMMLVMSLLISIPYGLIFMIFGAALMGAGQRQGFAAGGGSVVAGLGIMIGLPIFYGVIGFIFGAIGALLYNLFAGMVGGIEIEAEIT
ncbi:MAG: hypothetical protein ACR2LT_02610 [Pyrinomonadaceae bacterium]